MELTRTSFKHCDLIKVKGRIDSSTSPELSKKIEEITKSGRFKLIIDLADVDFISSAGLRVLIGAQKTCRRYNRGEVYLSAVSSKIQAALDLAGFTLLFKIFKDALTAVGSF
jgi:anti-sigma B factor antagonist